MLATPRPRDRQKIDEPVDLAQKVIVLDVPLQTEAIEQRLLHHPPHTHHRPNLLHPAEENQRPAPRSSGVFQRNLRTPAVRFAQIAAIPRRQWANGKNRAEAVGRDGLTKLKVIRRAISRMKVVRFLRSGGLSFAR
jgi:hypothetical protein